MPTIEHMTIQRMDHVGIVVDDLADAVAYLLDPDWRSTNQDSGLRRHQRIFGSGPAQRIAGSQPADVRFL
jgi:hypothetical protein